MVKPPKMGRPPKPKNQVKAATLSIRLTKEERKAAEAEAEHEGVSVGEWARRTLVAATTELRLGRSASK